MITFTRRLDESLVIEAYRCGVFPMPLHASGFPGMGWWSPMRRGVLPLDSFRVTRSMRQAAKRYLTTVDCDFPGVIARCADPSRPHGWIDESIKRAFLGLHRKGLAHSIEVWDGEALVGGLYGLGIGGLFAGESMFHDPQHGRDASKVALMRLVDVLSDEHACARVIDVQWSTPHLSSLGAITIDRDDYLSLLDELLDVPDLDWAERRVPTVPEDGDG